MIENRSGSKSKEMNRNEDPRESIKKKLVFVQYRGKVTEDFARALHRILAVKQAMSGRRAGIYPPDIANTFTQRKQ